MLDSAERCSGENSSDEGERSARPEARELERLHPKRDTSAKLERRVFG